MVSRVGSGAGNLTHIILHGFAQVHTYLTYTSSLFTTWYRCDYQSPSLPGTRGWAPTPSGSDQEELKSSKKTNENTWFLIAFIPFLFFPCQLMRLGSWL